MNDNVKTLAGRIAEEFHGKEIGTGDELGVAGIIIDEFNLDPETVLAANEIKFTATVCVEVLLDEDEETYYQITFQ